MKTLEQRIEKIKEMADMEEYFPYQDTDLDDVIDSAFCNGLRQVSKEAIEIIQELQEENNKLKQQLNND